MPDMIRTYYPIETKRTKKVGTCFFSDTPADSESMPNYDATTYMHHEYGLYSISRQAKFSYGKSITKRHKLLCLQETVKLNSEGIKPFWVLSEPNESSKLPKGFVWRNISSFEDKLINHENKEQDLINHISKISSHAENPFEFQKIMKRDLVAMGIFSDIEYGQWIKGLLDEGLLDITTDAKAPLISGTMGQDPILIFSQNLMKEESIRLTQRGWKLAYQLKSPLTTRQVFIAMAFTDSKGVEIPSDLRDTIKRTLNNLNWNGVLVDEVPHNDGVMDKIIASINESRFVIADLTYHKAGVYLEGGYAKGRNLPVIFSVKADFLQDCHFDVKHLNLIVWKDLEDLETKLTNRIKATIT